MAVILAVAFVPGILTILAPCIWPVVPLVVGAAATGGRRRSLGILAGASLSFLAVTIVLASPLAVAGLTTDRLRIGGFHRGSRPGRVGVHHLPLSSDPTVARGPEGSRRYAWGALVGAGPDLDRPAGHGATPADISMAALSRHRTIVVSLAASRSCYNADGATQATENQGPVRLATASIARSQPQRTRVVLSVQRHAVLSGTSLPWLGTTSVAGAAKGPEQPPRPTSGCERRLRCRRPRPTFAPPRRATG
jgi:hypothetical protein